MNSGVYFFIAFLIFGFGFLIWLKRYEKRLWRQYYGLVDQPDPWTYEWHQEGAGPDPADYRPGPIVTVMHAEKGWMQIVQDRGTFFVNDETGAFMASDDYLHNAIEEAEEMLEKS